MSVFRKRILFEFNIFIVFHWVNPNDHVDEKIHKLFTKPIIISFCISSVARTFVFIHCVINLSEWIQSAKFFLSHHILSLSFNILSNPLFFERLIRCNWFSSIMQIRFTCNRNVFLKHNSKFLFHLRH